MAEQISISIIGGILGGLISFYFATKQTKLAHKITLRETKFDDFTKSIIWLKDMIDIVTNEVNFNFYNYKEYDLLIEFKSFDLFNKIFEQGSNCTSLVKNYGKLFESNDLLFSEITEVHGYALNIALRLDYYARNKNEEFRGLEKLEEENRLMNDKWGLLRNNLINIHSSASHAREKDLK